MTTTQTIISSPVVEAAALKLLLVEDDDFYFQFLNCLLRDYPDAKFSVCRASSLAEALNYLARETPAAILLDLNLPDSRGLATLTRLQKLGERCPIVILTGTDERTLGSEAIARGAADFLVKQNTDIDSLTRCIRYSMLKKADEARTRILAIQDFMATLAHDMQVPMVGAKNVVEALLLGVLGELNPMQAQALQELQLSNVHQLHLIQKLIQIYRYESAVTIQDRTEVDLQALLTALVEEHRERSEALYLDLVLTLPSRQLAITGDGNALSQMFSGLLDNAIRYSFPLKTVEISATEHKGYVSVQVKNFGEPILPDQGDTLFQRFWTGKPGRRYVANTGFGLYLCHHIATLHGGKINYTSDAITGTTFIVTLPSC
jgi:signal transduction histidine kinase